MDKRGRRRRKKEKASFGIIPSPRGPSQELSSRHSGANTATFYTCRGLLPSLRGIHNHLSPARRGGDLSKKTRGMQIWFRKYYNSHI